LEEALKVEIKTVKISEEVWKRLTQIKLDHGFKTLADALDFLLKGEVR